MINLAIAAAYPHALTGVPTAPRDVLDAWLKWADGHLSGADKTPDSAGRVAHLMRHAWRDMEAAALGGERVFAIRELMLLCARRAELGGELSEFGTLDMLANMERVTRP